MTSRCRKNLFKKVVFPDPLPPEIRAVNGCSQRNMVAMTEDLCGLTALLTVRLFLSVRVECLGAPEFVSHDF